MIGKLTKGNEFGPLLSYLFRKTSTGMERGTLLGGTLAGESIADLRRELQSISRLRGNTRKPVRHLSIALRPGEHLAKENWLLVARQLAQEMGWDSYGVVQHHDRDHEHIHIVASRVRADGSLAREVLRDFRKVEGALRILEDQFGLEPVPSPIRSGRIHQRADQNTSRPRGRERALAERTRAPTIKQRIRSLVDQSIESACRCQGARPFPQFLEELRTLGVSSSLNIRGARVTGITFEFEGEPMKGSDLGKPYGFTNLAKTLGYDPSLDLSAVSPDTVLERARQHTRRIADDCARNPIAPWSPRTAREPGPDSELGGRVAGITASGAMESSAGMGDMEGHGGGAHVRGSEGDLGYLGDPPEGTHFGRDDEFNAQGPSDPRCAEGTSLPGRASDFCGGNTNGTHLDRSTAGSSAHIPGEPNGPGSSAPGRFGRTSSASLGDAHIDGGQRSAGLETGQALGVGRPLSREALPPLDPGSLRALVEKHLPKLTKWFALHSRGKLMPETAKSLVVATDRSWSIDLGPCHPNELPLQVERLAETSLAYGSHEDRGEAYWTADDTVREAYDLAKQESSSAREQGFTGWLESRLDLVRSGWKKLVEVSKALAKKNGDPLAEVEAEDRAKNLPSAGDRWSQIGRLEQDLKEDHVRDAIEIKPRQPLTKPKGMGR